MYVCCDPPLSLKLHRAETRDRDTIHPVTPHCTTTWFWICYFKVKKVTLSKISTWRLHNHVSRLKVHELLLIVLLLPGARWPPKAVYKVKDYFLTPFSALLRPRDWRTETINFLCPHSWQPWLHVRGKSQQPQQLMVHAKLCCIAE